jgi:glycosyltransferase involved in cell wall biosynthesis
LCVVFAGRLLEEKGAGLIVQAARELVDDPSIHFFIAGSGPMEPISRLRRLSWAI